MHFWHNFEPPNKQQKMTGELNEMLIWKYTVDESDPALCDCCNCDCFKYYIDDSNGMSVYVLCEFCFEHKDDATPDICKVREEKKTM